MFDDTGATTAAKGGLESTMITVNPCARLEVTERGSAWSLADGCSGDMTIVFDDGTDLIRASLSLQLGAAGARGELLPQDADGGLDLALKANAFLVRTESETAAYSAATSADASRLRLVLEGGRSFDLGRGATVRPALELGVRHDGGDAQTGAGVEIGGSVIRADLASGLILKATARLDPGAWAGALVLAQPDHRCNVERGRAAVGRRERAGPGPGRRRVQAGAGPPGGGGLRHAAAVRLHRHAERGLRDGGRRAGLDAVRRETVDGDEAEHGLMLRSSLGW